MNTAKLSKTKVLLVAFFLFLKNTNDPNEILVIEFIKAERA